MEITSHAKEAWIVINTDNFNGDYPNESVVSTTYSDGKNYPFLLHTLEQATNLANAFNSGFGATTTRWYCVRQLPYTLQGPFEP